MDNTPRKILLLVEGAKTDYQLTARLLDMYHIRGEHEIVSYDTNIYALYNAMFRDGDPYSRDLLQTIKEQEHDPAKRALLDARYSDIMLIFDLDPQDEEFSESKIREMVDFFVESSDMGKLYLNYPMVESFYHMKSIPDENYYHYTASLEELRNNQYKSRVNRESFGRDYRKFARTMAECSTVIKQNIAKAWFLTEQQPPASCESVLPPEAKDILEAQLALLKEQQLVSVLCTCVFYIADYNPRLLEEQSSLS